MNFISTFEELNKLYESVEPETEIAEESITEAAEEEVVEIVDETEEVAEEPVEEPVESEPKQVVLECANCGAVVIKVASDVSVDEESDLANVEDPCQYCEETAGYKILGALSPYTEPGETEESDEIEEPEVIEEGIFDKLKSKKRKEAEAAQEQEKVARAEAEERKAAEEAERKKMLNTYVVIKGNPDGTWEYASSETFDNPHDAAVARNKLNMSPETKAMAPDKRPVYQDVNLVLAKSKTGKAL